MKLNQATSAGIMAMIRADQDADSRTKAHLLAIIKSGGVPPPDANKPNRPLVFQRTEAARLASRSRRWIDEQARRGLLRRVKLPGKHRAIGIRSDDLFRLIESSTVAVEGAR